MQTELPPIHCGYISNQEVCLSSSGVLIVFIIRAEGDLRAVSPETARNRDAVSIIIVIGLSKCTAESFINSQTGTARVCPLAPPSLDSLTFDWQNPCQIVAVRCRKS